jgi:WD40 repeat protein/ABC-type transport system substrate-binding protein
MDKTSNSAQATTIYTVGGTVQASNGLYIPRHSDNDLLTLCQEAAFAYVLAPRQLGKSSLMIRTAERLQEEGILSVIIDLTQLGVQLSADAWYLGLLTMLEDSLILDTDVVSWWQAHSHLGNAQRLILFFQDLVLTKLEQPLVVFVDEIDTTLSLNFTDDFYAAIRSLYVARARIPELKRLSFVLIGVASPGDLIRDPKRTPFNIGQRVEMTDFKLEEALPLAKGLGAKPGEEKEALGWVFKWTGGHPYLTQRLCRVIAENGTVEGKGKGEGGLTEDRVDHVVNETFFGEKSFQDNNLQFVRDMLTRRTVDLEEVLGTFRQIRAGKQLVSDDEQSLVKSHLKLSGIVRVQGVVLRVRNEVYRTVFDERWIKEHLPVNWAKRLRQALGIIAASILLALVMGGLAVYALVQQGAANDRASQALSARNTAEARRVEADKARTETEQQARISKAQALAANALAQLEVDPERSILLAVEAVKLAQQPGTEVALAQAGDALRQSLERARLAWPPLTGHTGPVNTAAFSPDGKEVLTASEDGTARVWNFTTGQTRLLLKGPNPADSNTLAIYSPDGQTILTAYGSGGVRLWQAQSGRELFALNGHTGRINSTVFSADGRYIVTGSQDGTARLWEVSTGQQLADLIGHDGAINKVTISPDGKYAATGGADHTARLWEIPSGKELTKLGSYTDEVTDVAFSPDGQEIVTASSDLTAGLFEIQSGKRIASLNGHTGKLNRAIFSPDGRYIATISSDSSAKIWEASSSKLLFTLSGHTARILDADFSPDSRYLVTASGDQTARIWEASTGKLAGIFKGHTGDINSVRFSPDGRYIVTGSADQTARVWESLTGKKLSTFVDQNQAGEITSADLSPDGRYLVTGSSDNSARIWDVQSRKLLNQLTGHTDWVTAVAYSPDSHYIATASRDNPAKLWDAQTGQEKITFKGHVGPIASVSFSPDGRYLVTASWDQTARVWDVTSGQPLVVFKGHQANLTAAAFSPDGRYVVTASLDGTAIIWGIASGQEVITLIGHQGTVNQAVFSPDGKTIVTAGKDGTARLWEVARGNEIIEFKGHTDQVNSAAFSQDGKNIVTASADGTVRLWQVQSDLAIASLQGHTGPVYMANYSRDGRYIVTAGADGTAQVHLASADEMLGVAQERLTRQLTIEEQVRFGLVTAPPSGAATPTATAATSTASPASISPTASNKVANGQAIPTLPPDQAKVDLIEDVKFDGTGGKKGGQINFAFAGQFPTFLHPYYSGETVATISINMIYAMLIGRSDNGKYYPYLLTEVPTLDNGDVKVAADNQSMEIYLRLKPGLKWSDGSLLTSKDVAFTVTWATDPDNTDFSQDVSIWNLISGVDTPDDLTAVLKFKKVYGPYLMFLNGFYPLPQKVWGKIPVKNEVAINSPETKKPTVTSGPMRVDEFAFLNRLVLSRNDYFSPVWGFNAYLDRVNFFSTPDQDTALHKFTTGELDEVENLIGINDTNAPKGPNLRFESVQSFAYEYLQLNLSNPIFQDKAVRQALDLALDKPALVKQFNTPGTYQLPVDLVPFSLFANKSLQPSKYNPESARRLLEAAGWKVGTDGIRLKDGQRLAFTFSTTNSASYNAPFRLVIGPLIIGYWKAIGADVKFQTYDPASFFGPWNRDGILSRGKFDIGEFAQTPDSDPDGQYINYHSSQIPSDQNQFGANYGRINDPLIDQALDFERNTADQNQRKAAWFAIQKEFYDNTYEIPLFNRVSPLVVNNRIKNFKPNITYDGNFWNVVELYIG